MKIYVIQRSKQEFMQVNKITLFSENMQGAFVGAGVFIRINTVFKPDDTTFDEIFFVSNSEYIFSLLPGHLYEPTLLKLDKRYD